MVFATADVDRCGKSEKIYQNGLASVDRVFCCRNVAIPQFFVATLLWFTIIVVIARDPHFGASGICMPSGPGYIYLGGFQRFAALKALLVEGEMVGNAVRPLCHRELLEGGSGVLGVCDGRVAEV